MPSVHRPARVPVAPDAAPRPITDAETHHALSHLKRYPSGLSRPDLERLFGSDRRGRLVMAAIVERAIAAIVVVESPYHGGGKVYRLARDADEVAREEARLRSYEESARRRREGLRLAFERGPQAPQAELF